MATIKSFYADISSICPLLFHSLSTQLLKQNYLYYPLPLAQHHSFLRNLPPFIRSIWLTLVKVVMSRNACSNKNGKNSSNCQMDWVDFTLINLTKICQFHQADFVLTNLPKKLAKIVKSINIHSVWQNLVKSAIFAPVWISGHKWRLMKC